MLAVAVAGMLVYSAAGAATGDGKEPGPAKPTTTTTSKCEPTTSTTRKDGDKEPTTSTTRKDGDKEPTTSTTRKDGDKEPTTSTTRKDGDKEPTTSTTRKDGDKEPTTSTTEKRGDGKDDADPAAAKAAAPSGVEIQGAAVPTAAKDADGDGKASKADADKDCGATTTTRKGDGGGKDDGDGKGSTTSTTRKRPTTTTTEKKDDGGGKAPTTTTTRQRAVEPHTPNPDDSGTGGSPEPGGSADPGGTPIEPQEAPPADAADSGGEQAAEPEDANAPEPGDDTDSFDIWDDDEEYAAIDPMESPGTGSPLPVFNQLIASSSGKASDVNRRERSRSTGSRSRGSGRSLDDSQELAYSPEALTSRSLTPAAVVESESARRRLGGTRASSAGESALPADAISTPGDLGIDRRNPLAAAALVLLIGVSRELFKVWRRRAFDFWPA